MGIEHFIESPMSSFLLSALLCGLLSIVVVLPIFPLRISLLAYLVTAHLSLSDPNLASATTMGIENALRVIILPTVLLLRTRFAGFKLVKSNLAFLVWIVFGLYVVIASFWSPFQLSAIKQIGYMYNYTVGLFVFAYAYQKDKTATYRIISWSLLLAIGLAFLQTFILGNLYSNVSTRLTSFRGAQSFGLYLAIMFAVILSFPHEQARRSFVPRWVMILSMMLALFLNGSRSGFLAFLLIIACSTMLWPLARRSLRGKLIPMAMAILLTVTVMVSFLFIEMFSSGYADAFQSNRLLQVLGLARDDATLEDIGTARFRIQMYQTILLRMNELSTSKIVFGNGTASVGELIALGYYRYRGFDAFTIDANRIAHNEFLRAIYEWGIVGSVLFMLLLITLLAGSLKIARKAKNIESYTLVGALLATILLFMTQNIFAASSAPTGSALILCMAQLANLHAKYGARPGNREIAPIAVRGTAVPLLAR
jgi:O-antigen ligase